MAVKDPLQVRKGGVGLCSDDDCRAQTNLAQTVKTDNQQEDAYHERIDWYRCPRWRWS